MDLKLRAEVVFRNNAVPDSPVAVCLNAKVVGAADDAEPSGFAPVGAPAEERVGGKMEVRAASREPRAASRNTIKDSFLVACTWSSGTAAELAIRTCYGTASMARRSRCHSRQSQSRGQGPWRRWCR